MTQKIIIGIETSCDDTSMAIIRGTTGVVSQSPEILAFESLNQDDLLARWGGVVPEIAARNHLEKIAPLLRKIVRKANLKMEELDGIGVTISPGLLGPLLTGVNAAKTLSMLYELPIVPVNHLYAHLEAIHISTPTPYPYLGLLVSGGHSLFMAVRSPTDFELLGTTLDDAAGEAFDKGGKLMGLGYPAGRAIDELAKEAVSKGSFEFSLALRHRKDPYLSFSGLKTALRNLLESNPNLTKDRQQLANLCWDYQAAIVDSLALKLTEAKKLVGDWPIVVGGGVACNSALRETLQRQFQRVFFVQPAYCTDNGAMVANLALRSFGEALAYPRSLSIDATSRFIEKGELLKVQRGSTP